MAHPWPVAFITKDQGMEYNLSLSHCLLHADVEISDNRQMKVFVDQRPYHVEFERISEHLIHMKVRAGDRERIVNAYVAPGPGGKTIFIQGKQYDIEDADQRTVLSKKKRSALDIPDVITPPMPAVVVKIFIRVGEEVKKGQGILAVSAMKMETVLCAPYDGIVTNIHCAVNDKVTPGQVLAQIQKKESL